MQSCSVQKGALGQALRVRLDNALEASHAGVSIEVQNSDNLVELIVSDEGMPPQVLQRAFLLSSEIGQGTHAQVLLLMSRLRWPL